MNYIFVCVETRKYERREKSTGQKEIVEISNRNGFPEREQLRLLNLNDSRFEYSLLK